MRNSVARKAALQRGESQNERSVDNFLQSVTDAPGTSGASSLARPSLTRGLSRVQESTPTSSLATPSLTQGSSRAEDRDWSWRTESNGSSFESGERSEVEDSATSNALIPDEDIDDKDVIQKIYDRTKAAKLNSEGYLALLAILLVTGTYLTILYLQANSLERYQASTAHYGLLPEGLTGAGGFSFPNTGAVYDWLNESIIQTVWAETDCGNGVCERPEEFQAFGRFGCPSDCGSNTNVSEIIVRFTTTFKSKAEMWATNWNLCMAAPTMFCWFDKPRGFTRLLAKKTYSLSIPDGNWTLVVKAPRGNIVGSVTFNGTYKWSTPDALKRSQTLVSLTGCGASKADSNLAKCRQMAGDIVKCAGEGVCSSNGLPVDSKARKSALFVDLIGMCNEDVHALDSYFNQSCTGIQRLLNVNGTLECGGAADNASASLPPARQLRDKPSGSPRGIAGVGARRMALAEANTLPSQFTDTLWKKLGASDGQRLRNLQVATQRALYSWVVHKCLVSVPMKVNNTARMAAFFCTYFGGPSYMEGCTYTGSVSNQSLTTDLDLAVEMKAIHARLNITLQQQEAFVYTFLLALQSVTTLDDTTAMAFFARLHQLDAEVINSTAQGCPAVSSELQWSVSQTLSSRIYVGDILTWLWADSEPHSISSSQSFGDDSSSTFKGMGTGRLIVSKNTICTSQNIGTFDVNHEPTPCILAKSNPEGQTVFSVSKMFPEEGRFAYTDGRNPRTGGAVVVTRRPNGPTPSNDSLAFQCAPECVLNQLRNGVCNDACNNAGCVYDGGDCSCSPDSVGSVACSCPDGQTPDVDGVCCEAYGVGSNLEFPFSISAWGPNVTESDANFLVSTSPPLFRYVSRVNRVLIGMVISQERWASQECKDQRFFSLFPNCTFGSSTASYGTNPVFLAQSSLFNEALAANDTLYYGNWSLGSDNATLRNSQGVPFGFEAQALGGNPAFNYFFDINFSPGQADTSLQFLRDGYFIDNATKEVGVKLVTYNGMTKLFTLFKVVLTFENGGKIPAFYDIESISAQPYLHAGDYFRLVLELIFCVCVVANVVVLLIEVHRTKKRTGKFGPFFHLWNVLDIVSLGLSVSVIVLWIYMYTDMFRPFQIELRYEIYNLLALSDPGQYWNIVPPGAGFAEALKAVAHMERMAYFRLIYMALNGINVLLMVLRILTRMDFQPRMGTITRTVAVAMPDLVHFFILFFIVFLGFAFFGHLTFGYNLDMFRTLPMALSTCFEALLGNDSVNDYLMQLQGWQLVAGVLFWWGFVIAMAFIILQLLLAIIVDAFIKVRTTYEKYPSMPSELLWLLNTRVRRLCSPVKTDRDLLRQLRAYGAEKGAQAGAEGLADGEESAPDVISLADREVTLEELEHTLARAEQRQRETTVQLRQKVSPKDIAHVAFQSFGYVPSGEITEVHRMVTEVDELKEQLEDLRGILYTLNGALKDVAKDDSWLYQ